MTSLDLISLVEGEASGTSFCLAAPLSLWDGIDSQTGEIIQGGHPDQGKHIGDTILIFSSGLSGATAGAALTETVRTGVSPVAIVLPEPDEIIVTASVTAELLYDQAIPTYYLKNDSIKKIPNNTVCTVENSKIYFEA